MPKEGKKSLTLYTDTIRALWKGKRYGETWDEYLLSLLYASGRAKKREEDSQEESIEHV